ncbi:MAG: protein-disulfide reductase DsbD domain-containing protein, partial [Planctomycetia bacterium]
MTALIVALLVGWLGGAVRAAEIPTLELDGAALDGGAKEGPGVTARLTADVAAVAPGAPFRVGVAFTVSPKFYFHYRSGGSIAKPTKIDFAGPAGVAIGAVRFPGPEAKYLAIGDKVSVSYVYKRDVVLFAEATAPADAKPGDLLELSAKVDFQFCKEDGQCFFEHPKLTLKLPVAAAAKESADIALFTAAAAKLPKPVGQATYVTITPVFSQDKLRPGDMAELSLVVDVKPGYKIQMNQPPVKGLISTDVFVEAPPEVKPIAAPTFPAGKKLTDKGFENVEVYSGRVVVRTAIEARKEFKNSVAAFRGLLRYQACEESGSCFPPEYVEWSLDVPTAAAGATVSPNDPTVLAAATPASLTAGKTEPKPAGRLAVETAAAAGAKPLPAEFVVDDVGTSSFDLPLYLLYAFLGGLILNVMPCVLPV